jgi:hypothetical protein
MRVRGGLRRRNEKRHTRSFAHGRLSRKRREKWSTLDQDNSKKLTEQGMSSTCGE